eukprot:TRINITY_DN6521_c0_g1_i1.p1 TRINITY_DN6521_c0_g1~~TRINITY_DN6521_c0_g1_i1.p1  ORF type:complete len:265 (-),score=32.33 TRINITY_DN6521_c0_g1_i1:310-1059(-)
MDDDQLPQRTNNRRRPRPQQEGSSPSTSSLVGPQLISQQQSGEITNANQEETYLSSQILSQQEVAQQMEIDVELEEGWGLDDEWEGTGKPMQYAPLEVTEYRTQAVQDYKFEYLDHTADVQLHAWGCGLQEAFEQVGLAMFNYMTPLAGVQISKDETRQYEVEGHDLDSLLFAFLDELLFIFSTELFVCKQIQITSFDRQNFKITANGYGEIFDRQRHEQGTEVKAITYSAMQIIEKENDAEVFVIIDI